MKTIGKIKDNLDREITLKVKRVLWLCILTAIVSMMAGAFLEICLITLLQRDGTVGGEVLVVPLLASIFYFGFQCGRIKEL